MGSDTILFFSECVERENEDKDKDRLKLPPVSLTIKEKVQGDSMKEPKKEQCDVRQ